MYFLLHPVSSLNHLVARLLTDQITILVSLVFFILLAINYKNHFWKSMDKMISLWAEDSEKTFISKRSEDFAIFGNAIFHILFSVILCIIFSITKHKFSIVLSILFALIFSWGLNRFLKIIFKRPRPGYTASGARKRQSYCFPSGHVMASIAIYFFSAVLLQNLIPFLPWYLIAFIVSIFVILSRLYLSHHYFTDVLGGIVMGIFCLNISIWFYFFVGLM